MSGRHAAPRQLHPRALLALAGASTVLAATFVGGGAQAAVQGKYFTVTAPQAIAIGATSLTLTVNNCGGSITSGCPSPSQQPFGSVRIDLPAAVPVANQLNGGATITTSSAGKAASWQVSADPASMSAIVLTNTGNGTTAAIAPGESLSITLSFPAVSGGDLTFGVRAKQSNDFSGSGNDFLTTTGNNRPGTTGSVTVHVGIPDHLAFGQGPSDVQVTASATKYFMSPSPTVDVVDANGDLVTWVSGLAVTLTNQTPVANGTQPDPGLACTGTSGGATTAPTVAGVATFGPDNPASSGCTGLYATNLGAGYALGATATWNGSTLTTEGTAPTFSVVQWLQDCPAAGCTTPTLQGPGGHTSASVNASPGTDGLLRVAIGLDSKLSCWDKNPYRAVTAIDLAGHSKVVTLVWDKQAVQWQTNNGAPFWNVCFSAPYQFPTTSGYTDGAQPPYEGDLVDCGTVDTTQFAAGTYPCVLSRGKQAANEVVQVSIPLNGQADPKMA